MRKLAAGLAAVAILGAAAHLVVYWLVPVGAYTQALTQFAAATVGAEVTITGDAHLSLLPRPTLKLTRARLTTAPAAALPDLVDVDELHLQLAPLSLLTGDVVVEHLILFGPHIRLVAGEGGLRNWAFTLPGAATETDTEDAAEETEESPLADLPLRFRLSNFKVVQGVLSYKHVAWEQDVRLTRVMLDCFVSSLDGPLRVTGTAAYAGRPVRFTLDALNTGDLVMGNTTKTTLEVANDLARLTYQGEWQSAETIAAEGKVTVEAASARKAAAWLGLPLPDTAGGFGVFRANGKLRIADRRVYFGDAPGVLDSTTGVADVVLDLRGDRPAVSARLAVDTLDLTPYVGPGPPRKKAKRGKPDPPPDGPLWSAEPVRVDWLRAVNAHVQVHAKTVRLRDLTAGPTLAVVLITDGELRGDLVRSELYDGSLTGGFGAAAEGDPPAYRAAIALDGVQAEPLLEAAAGFGRVSGPATGRITVEGAGTNVREVVASLHGEGEFALGKGTLRGVDIAALTGNVVRLVLRPKRSGKVYTSFDTLSGAFDIRDGVVQNTEFALEASYLKLEGDGTVNLLDRSVAYQMVLRRFLLRVPLTITGTWNEYHVEPFTRAADDDAQEPATAAE